MTPLLQTLLAALLLAGAGAGYPEQGPPRSWSGAWSGEGAVVGKCENGKVLFVDRGQGDDVPLGKATWSSAYCLDPETGKGTGVGEETTADGDEIRMLIEVTIVWTSEAGGTWSEAETAIGGTGKFVAATGNSTTNGTFTATSAGGITTVWQGTSTGTITY